MCVGFNMGVDLLAEILNPRSGTVEPSIDLQIKQVPQRSYSNSVVVDGEEEELLSTEIQRNFRDVVGV